MTVIPAPRAPRRPMWSIQPEPEVEVLLLRLRSRYRKTGFNRTRAINHALRIGLPLVLRGGVL